MAVTPKTIMCTCKFFAKKVRTLVAAAAVEADAWDAAATSPAFCVVWNGSSAFCRSWTQWVIDSLSW